MKIFPISKREDFVPILERNIFPVCEIIFQVLKYPYALLLYDNKFPGFQTLRLVGRVLLALLLREASPHQPYQMSHAHLPSTDTR
jgi:hypothetical protein